MLSCLVAAARRYCVVGRQYGDFCAEGHTPHLTPQQMLHIWEWSEARERREDQRQPVHYHQHTRLATTEGVGHVYAVECHRQLLPRGCVLHPQSRQGGLEHRLGLLRLVQPLVDVSRVEHLQETLGPERQTSLAVDDCGCWVGHRHVCGDGLEDLCQQRRRRPVQLRPAARSQTTAQYAIKLGSSRAEVHARGYEWRVHAWRWGGRGRWRGHLHLHQLHLHQLHPTWAPCASIQRRCVTIVMAILIGISFLLLRWRQRAGRPCQPRRGAALLV
mmetsp:Transcript_30826/g.89656  ORF Transcript_30826/g.89656 Transcript_30826/m.89656 type:complete len:273 (-) Transcript_30826:359-1177(-)